MSTPLAIGAVAALAAAAELSKRGSLSLYEELYGDPYLFPVDTLWKFNKDAMWSSGITPSDLVNGRGDEILDEILAEEDLDPDGDTSLSDQAKYDIGSFYYWVSQFQPYAGSEDDIPTHWAVEVFDQRSSGDGYIIEDGLHRMAAARFVGLQQIPAKVG
jgi:hypothetical protein